MEVVVSTTTESVLQIATRVMKQQLSYFFNYNDKLDEVKCYIEMLDNTRKRIQHQVNNAEMNAEEIEDDVQHCLKLLDEKIKTYENFIHDEHHSKTRCSIGFFPNNLQLRYRLGRKATKMVEEMKAGELWNKRFDEVSYRVLPSIDVALTNTIYENFASRTKTMDMVMQALEDCTVNMIGIYGVGGVGKTTLVKEVAKIAQEKKLFNVVVMANIARIPNIIKIQGQIAEMLGMRLEEESEIVRADRIRKRLTKTKENTLIILDDLWDGLDLNRLGIPCSDEDDGSQHDVNDIPNSSYDKMEKEELSSDLIEEKLSDNQKRCKILLTSRRKQVLCNKMDVQEKSTFSVGVLPENEAKTLLKKVAGIHDQNLVYDEKALEIARMCDGLPIALVSIGKTLKNKSSFVWVDVYQQMKKQSFVDGKEPIEFSIKLSYDHLENEQLKCIFLHCARMGNDALVMDVVKFCIGLGLLQGVHTIREARNKVTMLIEELKESSLVLESYSSYCFNMHDIVRDVALLISSKEKHIFFMKNGILDEWPHKDQLERYTAIVLQYCYINDDLPESIYCPRLEVLHIDNKDHFLKIPDDFFRGMIELRVLILNGLSFPCLPSSIMCLTKLRMLTLKKCTIGQNLSIIGKLKKLRILNLSGSNIECFPFEFGQLVKLQLLDLSNCSKLKVIPSNVISKMNSLEEFYMQDSLIQWETEENIQSQNGSLCELRHLNQLRNLDIHIQNVVHVPRNFFLDELDSYKIIIGESKMLTEGDFKIPNKYEMVKLLALNLKEGIAIHTETWIKMLLKDVEYLWLGELIDVHDVFYELNVEGFQKLKHLSIVNNIGLQYIINSVERFHPLLAFPKLESLYLYKLYNLKKLCNNQLLEASFYRLKTIKIKSCDKLESLFPFSMVKHLTMLETIEVCDCDSLMDMVSVGTQTHTNNGDNIEFPQLRLLTLKSLHVFTCLYTNDKIPCAQPFEDKGQSISKDIITGVYQDGTNSCLSLFNEKVSIPKLEWLELSSTNIQKIWSDQSQHCFQNLLTLNVTDCGNLKYLVSFSMAGHLVNLQTLSVSECEMMEDIFRPEEVEGTIDYMFPKLKKMEITCMEKLNTIWQPQFGLHSFCGLDSLIIRECHKLDTIFPSFMGQRFQSLQSLTITNCKSVENIFVFANIPQTCDRNETNLHKIIIQGLPNLVSIWKHGTGEILKHNNLQRITVSGCPNLKYVFPLSITNDLENLEFLEVRNCRTMKEIVAWDRDSNKNDITFKFAKLENVSLQSLFELVSFYGGTHTLEWPSLKKLSILRCGKLEGITTKISNSQAKPIVLATEKVIYNLEHMAMSFREVEWLQNYIVNVHRMLNLQSIALHGLKNAEILFWFLHRIPNLKRLTVGLCHLRRIWGPATHISQEKIGVVMQLKELVLKSMWSLEEIGFEHEVLLQRVQRLIILRCTKLKNLASSTVSFNRLTYLEVANCMMKNLMTYSTAKTLVQLTTMKVSSCPMIAVIVAKNEGENVQEIEFKQLRSLELVSLPNLTSFLSVDKCVLKFSLLENLVVSECPQMTKFSEVLSTPNLQKVHAVTGEKDKWYWEGDLNATLQKHFPHQVFFKYSKHMKLKDYPEMKEVRYGKPVFSDNFFGSLKKLEFDVASKRDIVIPSHVLPYLKNLEELKVERCKPAEVIFDLYESETKTIVFQLKKLTLKDLSNLKCVWNKNPKGIINFPNLEEVFIYECETLATLFPLTLAKNLGNLKTLTIHKCFKLIEIVEKKEETERGTIETFEFPRLLKLFLWNLPQLNCFYSGQHHLKCPMLERLHVAYCHKVKLFKSGFQHSPLQHPMFSIEEVVPKLKELMLSEKNIILLNDRHSPQDLLHKINYLDISFEDHDSMKNTLPFDFLHKVPNLENLVVRGYCGLKELFPSQKLDGHDGMLPELNKLSLQMVFELESIGLDHPWVKPYTEKLKVLAVGKCHRLERLVSCATSFIDLKQLVVKDCKRMKNLFTFPTAKSLMNLETLVIENCASIKEIIEKEDEDVNDEILLGRLSNLSLHSLPRLVSFYSGNATLNFSSLQQVKLFNCPSMKTFCETNINAPMLYGIKSSTDDFNLDLFHDLNTTIESFFYEKDFFEYSKHTILLDYFEMRGIGSVKQASQGKSFGNIKKLEFDGKSTGDTVIPSNVLSHLKSLEELNVHNSDEVQVIFGMNDSHTKTKETVFHLKILTLKDLSNLKCIVSKNPQESVSFPNLQKLFVDSCGSLVTLIARNLGKLNTHEMQRYDKLVEIVGKEDAIENRTTEVLMFEFPCLSLLTLYNLTNLSCFYPEKHHLECPKLEIMHVAYCPKLKLFTSKIHDSHKEAITEAPISCLQQPLFIVEKVVPKLKGLTLNEKNMMLFSDARMPQDYLSKLSLLRLCFEDDKNEKGTLPFDFLHRVPNLEHFRVQRCFGTKEIFSSKKLKVHDGIPATLNALTLFELNELESIGFEHPWVKPFSEKLQTLRVISCPWLEKLGRGALSFINLKELYVMDCGRIEYLFTFSTAKSLVLLETLIVRNCESIKEIAMKEDEDDCDEIIFERLTTLTLNSLPRLQSFLAGNAIMQFSCLKNAYVINCPNMKTFSDGVLTAPRFLGIKTSYQDSDLFFHDDLNTSFQRLFQTQVEKSACDTEHLKFGDHSHLQEIWLGVAPISTNNSFNNLKSLTVVECESFPNVIPFHLLPFLCNLKEIEVSNCQSVKAIFDVNGEGADMKPISLPLKKLVLNQLPNLEHIWNLNPDEILSLQDLQQVSISNCQTLKSLFPTSVANHLVKLHVRACATLVEIFAEADEAINGETKQFNFHCLTSLTLWELPELKYLYPGKHTLEWPMLTQLDIYHCDQLKLFKTEHHSDEFAHTKDQLGISIHQQAAFSVEKVFPKLVQLSLKKEDAVAISQAQLQVMPSIEHQEITWKDTMIGQGQFGANVAHLLQNLKLLKLMCYHEDDNSNIFSSGLLEEIPNIENLEVVCSSFTEIFCSQGPATDCSKVLSKLKRLHLKNLSQLNAIGLEHSWVEPLLKTLETLEVFSCPTMKILVPSTLSFSNLTSLNVGECHGLIYVFTSSTAKRLGQLKNISIRDCQAIQEIVSKEEDHESEDEDEEITFDQLSLLSLESLPNIIGIYSGTFKLKFPCLDQVTLKECPQMKYSYVPDLHEFKPQEQT
ncbi:uncharacterized protein LOC106759214 isoform X1 [Vigna radiata var. radiata]|uniref:Uncharacterized protein LOC106759214 isoform X1 n=1 Tax=Vigna radiata var. radiata TaxID=3916 RepID=A0A1S3TVG2_VIGRR|nr:uncharacterized protein LOC106759214 isoform X1 [Vigna radiata var. radiata]